MAVRKSQPTTDDELQVALVSGNPMEIWDIYRSAWLAGQSLTMSSDMFGDLFVDQQRCAAAIALAKTSTELRERLRQPALNLPLRMNDGNVRKVLQAVATAEEILAAWPRVRATLQAAERRQLAHSLVSALVSWKGRQWTRERVPNWWAPDLLEEEQDGMLWALSQADLLSRDVTTRLGPRAQAFALRSGAIRHPEPPEVQTGSARLDASLKSLLATVQLRSDFRASGFSSEEMESLQLGTRTLTGSADNNVFSVTLMRWLHMRLLLGAPSLRSALAYPEEHLAPAILLHTLGQDAVSYIPEVRMHQDVERRWRARWAELSGEALSVLVLEDALDIDLTLLARIPERNDEETPDFQVGTRTGEPIVFESKGSTDFGTHQRQRKKALAQLKKLEAPSGKGARAKRGRAVIPWKGQGRAFACCFYAATRDSAESSLMHVADPPFAFADLFRTGWEEQARRTHYAAAAEVAGLFSLADVLGGKYPEEARSRREGQIFRLGTGDRMLEFEGTYSPLDYLARQLNHPAYREFANAQMFVGLATQHIDSLLGRGIITAQAKPARLFPSSGTLPPRKNEKLSNGVYSLLSDGSFVAIAWP